MSQVQKMGLVVKANLSLVVFVMFLVRLIVRNKFSFCLVKDKINHFLLGMKLKTYRKL